MLKYGQQLWGYWLWSIFGLLLIALTQKMYKTYGAFDITWKRLAVQDILFFQKVRILQKSYSYYYAVIQEKCFDLEGNK